MYEDGELDKAATNKKYLLVQNEGNRSVRRNISHYNLDMILAIGMRIRSDVAFRDCAHQAEPAGALDRL